MAGVFSGQVAVVTGAAQGLGRAITEMLLRNGARVLLFDVDQGKGEEAVKLLGKEAKFFKVGCTRKVMLVSKLVTDVTVAYV